MILVKKKNLQKSSSILTTFISIVKFIIWFSIIFLINIIKLLLYYIIKNKKNKKFIYLDKTDKYKKLIHY